MTPEPNNRPPLFWRRAVLFHNVTIPKRSRRLRSYSQ